MSDPVAESWTGEDYLHLELLRRDRCLVLRPTAGVLAVAGDIAALRGELHDAVKKNPSRAYVLDLGKVGFISSAFLGAMVELSKKFRTAGAQFRVCNVQSGILKVLQAGKLDTVIDIRTDLADALHLS